MRAAFGLFMLVLGSGCGALLGIDEVPEPDDAGAEAGVVDAADETTLDVSRPEDVAGEPEGDSAAETADDAKKDATAFDAPTDVRTRDAVTDGPLRDASPDSPRLPNEAAADAPARDGPADAPRRVDA